MKLHTCPVCSLTVRSDVQAGAHCPNACGLMRCEPITVKLGTRNCDARCTSAKGPNCSCKCNGKNHGAGWSANPGMFAAYTQSKNRAALRRGHGTSDVGQIALDLESQP